MVCEKCKLRGRFCGRRIGEPTGVPWKLCRPFVLNLGHGSLVVASVLVPCPWAIPASPQNILLYMFCILGGLMFSHLCLFVLLPPTPDLIPYSFLTGFLNPQTLQFGVDFKSHF